MRRLGIVDTTLWKCYFHDKKSTILLRRGMAEKPSKHIPFVHYNRAELHQISTNYEKELDSIIEARRKALTPKDIITVPVFIEVKSLRGLYDTKETGLFLTALVDPTNRVANEEQRSISSIKGHVIIMDNFGDSIFYCPDMKIDLEIPIPPHLKPGLQYVLDYEGIFGLPFYETKRTKFIRINSPEVPEKLKSAVALHEKIKAKYIPEAILFSDGTVLKDK
jgi:hypothetical protein